MTVYVDNARNPFGRMIMCHMLADTIEELMTMADKIGLQRRHFQPTSHPHFDVSLGYKAKAIALGAEVLDRKQMVAFMNRQTECIKTDATEQAAYQAATQASDQGRRALLITARKARASGALSGSCPDEINAG